eukprot:PITA_13932
MLQEEESRLLRFDNGGEYVSNELIVFCRDVRIKRELIVPYYPKQNGTTERKNRSILEVVKAMLHDQELSMFLWGEATRIVVYVQNKCPHRILDYMTPEEVFIEKRTKLKPSEKGTLVGYSENSKAFRVYIQGQRYIETCKDAIFDDDVAFWKSKGSHLDSDDDVQIDPKNVEPKPHKPISLNEAPHEEDIDHEPIESTKSLVAETRKGHVWLEKTLKEVEGHVVSCGTFRESKKPKKYYGYITPMCKIIGSKPSSYEEVIEEKVWKEVMTKKYQSILKNDVWEIVPRREGC